MHEFYETRLRLRGYPYRPRLPGLSAVFSSGIDKGRDATIELLQKIYNPRQSAGNINP